MESAPEVQDAAEAAPAPPPKEASPAEDPADEGSYPRFEVEGRILAGAERTATHPTAAQTASDSRQPFFLRQARVKLQAELHERIRLNIIAWRDARIHLRSSFGIAAGSGAAMRDEQVALHFAQEMEPGDCVTRY